MRRALGYARARGYVKHMSTPAEACLISISGISMALLKAIESAGQPPELCPDEDFAQDPIASFGMIEARLHRQKGMPFQVFFGLLKYYRQCYRDLVLHAGFDKDGEHRCRLFIDRCFDRIEIGVCAEWSRQPVEVPSLSPVEY
jgi:hypothetical protein